jgi:hypothetical protein
MSNVGACMSAPIMRARLGMANVESVTAQNSLGLILLPPQPPSWAAAAGKPGAQPKPQRPGRTVRAVDGHGRRSKYAFNGVTHMSDKKIDFVLQILSQQLMAVREAVKSLDTRTAALADGAEQQVSILETIQASIDNLAASSKKQHGLTRKLQDDVHTLAGSLDTLATAMGGLSEVQSDHERRIAALEARQR